MKYLFILLSVVFAGCTLFAVYHLSPLAIDLFQCVLMLRFLAWLED